jgi:hypothetical protein
MQEFLLMHQTERKVLKEVDCQTHGPIPVIQASPLPSSESSEALKSNEVAPSVKEEPIRNRFAARELMLTSISNCMMVCKLSKIDNRYSNIKIDVIEVNDKFFADLPSSEESSFMIRKKFSQLSSQISEIAPNSVLLDGTNSL